ncbi:MFS transporter [Amycolatopsis sp. AA4]|uniref:MFS transporter n=1 Tax=Actinomycetes TaxID=1760 RepID=UPI0001B54B56|nr:MULTISPECIES: MFS transporter [Actinomycetes]ATY13499.1 MFS transporter [Amycolatopsis sp. AA4]EFL09456.1 metabolite transporter [Streptomyces sp. AA4]
MTTSSTAMPRKLMVAGLLSSALEWHDFFIYGTAAALVLGKLFFPSASGAAGILMSFATFWAGFIARPLGGVVLGSLGDRIGRKPVLLISLIAMAAATILIGLLPTAATIGVAAPILLVVLRFAQGIAVGGQWGGAVLLLTESAGPRHRGRAGTFGQMGAPLGFVLGSLAFIFVSTATTSEQFFAWGWRVPFLASVLLVPVVLFIHFRIEDSPEFRRLKTQAAEKEKVEAAPIRELLRTHPRLVLIASGLLFACNAMSYVIMTGVLSYGVNHLGLSKSDLLTTALIAAMAMIGTVYVSGALSDRFGRRRVIIAGSVAVALWTFPFFWLVNTGSIVLVGVASVAGFSAAGVTFGPAAAYIAELFPPRLRFSGATLAYQTAAILVSGSTPFLMTALLEATGTSASVSAFLLAMALVTLASAWVLPETFSPGSATGADAPSSRSADDASIC